MFIIKGLPEVIAIAVHTSSHTHTHIHISMRLVHIERTVQVEDGFVVNRRTKWSHQDHQTIRPALGNI